MQPGRGFIYLRGLQERVAREQPLRFRKANMREEKIRQSRRDRASSAKVLGWFTGVEEISANEGVREY